MRISDWSSDVCSSDLPSVKAAVTATVPDTKVRDFVFHYNGPDAPIVRKDGRILAWGCEVHNCGYHNWSISITPDGNSADVCLYHDDRSEEHTSELQSLMRISYAVFCLKKKKTQKQTAYKLLHQNRYIHYKFTK